MRPLQDAIREALIKRLGQAMLQVDADERQALWKRQRRLILSRSALMIERMEEERGLAPKGGLHGR